MKITHLRYCKQKRKIFLVFYHPILFIGLLNHASNKRTWFIKLGFNKPLYNFYYSLKLGILYIIMELLLQTRDDLHAKSNIK